MERGETATHPAVHRQGIPTIVSLRGLDRLMGQRSGLSNTDEGTINSMYP